MSIRSSQIKALNHKIYFFIHKFAKKVLCDSRVAGLHALSCVVSGGTECCVAVDIKTLMVRFVFEILKHKSRLVC